MSTVERAVADTSRWFPFATRDAPPDGVRLFCLPHAGGGASAFRGWADALPGVAVRPVQLPGREARFREPAYVRMAPLVADLADVVLAEAGAAPHALYGHSLGALVAFELARELRRRASPPAHLVVSGCPAPHVPHDDGPPVAGMARSELVETLRRLGGTPEWLLADPAAVDLVEPVVRADFAVKETTAHVPEAPLAVPITVLAATDDPRAPYGDAARWRELTTAEFRLRTLVGGHFAVYEQPLVTHARIAEALRPWT